MRSSKHQEGEWKKISDEHAMLSNSADILTRNLRAALDNLRDADDNAIRFGK